VLSAAEELDEQRDEITSLAEKQAAAVTGLVSALHVLGVAAEPAEGIDALRSRARQLLDEARKGKAQYDAAQNAVRLQAGTRSRAEQAVARLDVQIAQWTADWRAALEGAGLRPDAGIETATAMLDIMNRLDVARTQIEDLGHRIQAMTDDWERFQAAALGLAALLPDADRHDPILASRSLEARLKGALNAQADLEALRAQRTIRAAALDDARGRREQAEAALRSLCAQAGCSAPDELVQIEEKSADKRGAQARLADLEQRLREDGGGLDLPSLFAECDGFSGDQIPPEVAALAAERETSTRRIEDLMARRAELKAEFERQLGQEQAADSLQAAAGVEAEIQALVDTYAELTLQETALRQAIDLYRDRNQGPILGRAKALFAELTNGAYQGLRADVDSKDQPILIAEHPLRGSLDLAALTDGTVDPLYLALRLAVIQEHNANHEPMPFIADDLLLNLDDTRARAAFRTLAHVAADGQVIFFTHHAHMIELARASVPPGLLFEHRLQAPDRRREAAA
jgi:uncharacterized protein YhaN